MKLKINFIKPRKYKKLFKSIAISILVLSWLLTGYPGFWLRPVKAATTTVFLTTADTSPWTVPTNWGGMVSIEVIGGGQGGKRGTSGGNGGKGGDGGGYAKITSGFTTTAGSQISFQVGTGGSEGATPGSGGDTWFNSTSTVLANGGGSATARVGSTTYAGGTGGTASYKGGGGGGGAAGPIKTTTGIGKNGGGSTASTGIGGGGGGGSEGDSATAGGTTSSTTFGAGGNGWNGNGGGATSGAAGTAGTGGGGAGGNGGASCVTGGQGATGTNLDSSHGSGGGGGAGGGTATKNVNPAGGGSGGLYGGGGGGGGGSNNRNPVATGNGAAGLIVITYTIDDVAPTPNPMTFATSPNNDAAGQISMTASQASDNFVAQSAISYLFTNDNTTCTSGHAGTGGTSSSWQLNDRNYTDTGLDANKCYGYKVQAKDTAGNTTSGESVVTSYSSAAIPGTPTLGTPTSSTLALTNAENGNPATNPTTYFAVQVTTTTPTDSTWLNQWVNATGNPSATAVWLTDTQLDALVLQGLQPSTLYGVKVKARNQDNDETSLSAEGQGATSSTATATFSQNKYRWYYDNDLTNPTTAWGTPALAENSAIAVIPAGKDPPDTAQELRLRVNMVVNTAALSPSQKYFKLEYKAGTDGSCTAGSWTDVGTGVWNYATSTVTDGANITASLSDTTSGKGEQYVKSKPSALNNVGANVGEIIEYDFHIIGGTATPNTTYSFRVVGTDSGGTGETVLDAYTSCPTLTTEPGTANLLRHGQVFTNEVKQGFFWVN